MKNITLILLGGMLIGSCQKTKKQVNDAAVFDMSYTSEVSVPTSSTVPSSAVDFNTPDIETQSTSKFASENTTKDLIDEIKMTKFTISNPSGNLDFLQSITIYIKTTNMGDVKVASKSNIPAGTTSVDAALEDVNIKEYIFKDKIQFRINITFKAVPGPPTTQKLKVDETLHVQGKILS